MKVLIIYAHPNPRSFTKAVLDNFVRGIQEAGHAYEVIDLYKIKFNPVFQDMDFSFFVDEEMPEDLFRQMNLREMIIELAGGPVKRLVAIDIEEIKTIIENSQIVKQNTQSLSFILILG